MKGENNFIRKRKIKKTTIINVFFDVILKMFCFSIQCSAHTERNS